MGRNDSSIREFFEEMRFIESKSNLRMPFASKLSLRLLFFILEKRRRKTYNSIVLLITELLLSNCKWNILNRDPHFMLTITPSLSPLIGKASECFVRAKRSRIQWKWVVLAWASSRFSMLQVRTCSLRKMGRYFFLLIEKLATTKHALISIYTPIHSKMAKSKAIIKEDYKNIFSLKSAEK